ncbi:hypothetical protein SDC9_109733 [bioreactor metagenome]|uniref:Zinc-ribbon domain-containing protein n=1 Tax=bioreactor metagenome TaxID=1076179 RepID=A0A645BBN5_9ZZZZ
MKQYHHKEEAPLAFHKFFWYISLPIGFLVSISKMISEISQIIIFNWLYAIDIGYYIIALTLMLMCFIGFFGWKSYAWYGVMTYLSINVVYYLFAVIVYAKYIPDQIGIGIGQLLGILIYAILVGIYYKKRRPLFFKVNSQYSEVLPQVKYCSKCGYKLLDGSDFCSKCGTPVVKECKT